MFWGRDAFRHAVAAVAAGVALAALLCGGLLPPSARAAAQGESGPEVVALQQRLTELGYFVGPSITGRFDNNTTQAIYAFQKVEGLPTSGKDDPATRQRLVSAARPKSASTAGDLIEIDKARQILMVVRGGQAAFVFNASGGTERTYTYKGQRHRAHTPEGRFAVIREYDGYRESHLGVLYRPKYFDPKGFAFHGSSFVPPYPASHGCVRLSNAAINFIWDQKLAPIGSPLWIYGASPPGKAR
jgi:lipoprotein-anchoring transpeptidase ErfK/SrfK